MQCSELQTRVLQPPCKHGLPSSIQDAPAHDLVFVVRTSSTPNLVCASEFVGVFSASLETIIDLEPPSDTIKTPKYTLYEAGRFCNLLCCSNPNALALFFASEQATVYIAPIFSQLIQMRDKLITAEAIDRMHSLVKQDAFKALKSWTAPIPDTFRSPFLEYAANSLTGRVCNSVSSAVQALSSYETQPPFPRLSTIDFSFLADWLMNIRLRVQ